MAQKPKKRVVDSIIENLLNSEIPEIQQVAKQLTDWTKQLEEHSWKLQHYASEIENLAAQESAEATEELSLAELVRDLEKTLAELRQGPVSPAADKTDYKDVELKPPEKEKPVSKEKQPPPVEDKPPAAEKELIPPEEKPGQALSAASRR